MVRNRVPVYLNLKSGSKARVRSDLQDQYRQYKYHMKANENTYPNRGHMMGEPVYPEVLSPREKYGM